MTDWDRVISIVKKCFFLFGLEIDSSIWIFWGVFQHFQFFSIFQKYIRRWLLYFLIIHDVHRRPSESSWITLINLEGVKLYLNRKRTWPMILFRNLSKFYKTVVFRTSLDDCIRLHLRIQAISEIHFRKINTENILSISSLLV